MGSIAKGASTITILYFGAGAVHDTAKATAAIPAKDLKKSSSFYLLFFIVISVCTNILNIFVHPILSEVYKGISDPIPHLHPMQ